MPTVAIDQRDDAWAQRWGWLLIAAAVLLAYWPLSSFQWAVTHGDTLNCWLPWRWFIASSLHDGQFPLWNPHQQFGYPMHADLQGPSWYLEALALGGTIGHGVFVLQGLYLLYLFIGGLGMMRLVRDLHGDARAGLITGLAYALGGFFTGHQQHFYAVISAAWLPWLLLSFLRLLRAPSWKPAARVALFQGMLLTGGNHTFTIIGTYLLAALLIAHGWRAWRAGRWSALRPMLGWSIAAAIGSAITGAGALHALLDASPHLARSGAIAYDAAALDPVTWPGLISLLFPYAVGNDQVRIGADPSMANQYMGLIALALAAASVLRQRSMVENVLLVTGLLCALLSAGPALPFHSWVWAHVPGMDLFRFPSYFAAYTWISAMVLAGGTLAALFAGKLQQRHVAIVLGAAAMASIIVAANAILHWGADEEGISLFERMRGMHRSKRVLLGAAATLPALIIALVLAWRGRLRPGSMLLLVGAEMCWNTSLAAWNTSVSDIKPAWLERRLNALSDGPVIPDERPLKHFDDGRGSLVYLGHATQDFQGGFSRNGVNSFWLRNAMELEVAHMALWDAMAQQPVAYLADSIIAFDAYRKEDVSVPRDSGLVFAMPGHQLRDATGRKASDRAQVSDFDRNSFTIKCHTEGSRLLVLQQSHYPGWQVHIDGAPRPLLHVNIAAMAVEVPAGEHTVAFAYRKPMVPWLLALSLIAYFSLLGALVLSQPDWGPRIGAIALAGMVTWSLFGLEPKKERLPRAVERMLASDQSKAALWVNDDGHCSDAIGPARPDAHVIRANSITDVPLVAALLSMETPVSWIDAGLKADAAVRAAVLDRFEARVIERNGGAEQVELSPRGREADWLVVFRDDNPRLLTQEQPFGPGHEFELAPLRSHRAGSLVLDATVTGRPGAKAVFVVERKSGDRTTAYIAQPLMVPGSSTAAAAPAFATLPMDELWRPEERLKAYVWSHQGDTIGIAGFRIRVAQRRFDRW
ncbi:MAG TPA: hypothetical protein PKY96_14710 [Flavobacteriales bacterium]|nr:hypothetical protein [Flavobacteriales bacterium]